MFWPPYFIGEKKWSQQKITFECSFIVQNPFQTILGLWKTLKNRAQNMNSKPPKPNSQVSIYMNQQNEMEIAEKYSNLPYTLKKLQDFTFSEIKFLVGEGSGPPPPPPYKH